MITVGAKVCVTKRGSEYKVVSIANNTAFIRTLKDISMGNKTCYEYPVSKLILIEEAATGGIVSRESFLALPAGHYDILVKGIFPHKEIIENIKCNSAPVMFVNEAGDQYIPKVFDTLLFNYNGSICCYTVGHKFAAGKDNHKVFNYEFFTKTPFIVGHDAKYKQQRSVLFFHGKPQNKTLSDMIASHVTAAREEEKRLKKEEEGRRIAIAEKLRDSEEVIPDNIIINGSKVQFQYFSELRPTGGLLTFAKILTRGELKKMGRNF